MRCRRRFFQLGLFALVAAFLGLWAPTTRAHLAHNAARTLDYAEMARTDRAPAADRVKIADVERPASIAAAGLAGDGAQRDCPSGCCAGGASCASGVAGAPTAGVSLPEPGRPVFGTRQVRSLTASPRERLPKPPRG
jgi:hypothetical protein